MSAEKYQFDEVSTSLIEDLFDKLESRATKEFGKAWEQKRLSSGIARKALYLYTQPDAETLISEYLHADEEGYKSEDDLDAEMTFDQRVQTKDYEVIFEAERCSDEITAEMFTSYTVQFLSATPLDDIVDVPIQIRSSVAAKVSLAESDHGRRISEGELEPDEEEDFDSTVYFNKQHKYVLREPQELLNYSVAHTYGIAEYRVPMLTYRPDDDPDPLSLSPTQTIISKPADNVRSINDQQDDILAMFDEMMRHQDIEKPVAKSPAELRVAQIMAILAILDHGEAQNEEQEAIIKDLI